MLRVTERLERQWQRPPTSMEIAAAMGTDLRGNPVLTKQVDWMLAVRMLCVDVRSFDALGYDDDEGPCISLEHLVDESGPLFRDWEIIRLGVQHDVARLPKLEQAVVKLFYYKELNQTEIADRLGISVTYTSFLLRGAICKLQCWHDAVERELRAMEHLLRSVRAVFPHYNLCESGYK